MTTDATVNTVNTENHGVSCPVNTGGRSGIYNYVDHTNPMTPEEGEWPRRDAVPFAQVGAPFVVQGPIDALSVENTYGGQIVIADIANTSEPRADMADALAHSLEGYRRIVGWNADGTAIRRSDAPIGLKPVEVTEEMIAAAEAVWLRDMADKCWHRADGWRTIYLAMHAASPVPFVSDAEIGLAKELDNTQRLIVTRTEQRDAALAMRRETMDALAAMKKERDEALLSIDGWEFGVEMRDAIIAAKDDRIAELDTMLAKFTTANVPEREPKHNPFREFPNDPRRIGG